MPIKECSEDGRQGFQWGDSGKCFTHDGSEEGKRRARQQAVEQAQAAYAHGYEGNAAPAGVQRKMLEGGVLKMAPAQDSDMALIRQYFRPGSTVTAEDVMVVPTLLAHDQKDRSSERFPESYLKRFAETIPGRALMEGHDYSRRPQGRWFDSEVRPVGPGVKDLPADALGLFARFYVDAKAQVAREVDLGIVKDVSIGFIPDKLICDLCHDDVWGAKSKCPHEPGQQYDGKLATATYGGDASKAEAVEGSLVWLGCQPGAQVIGQSSPLYQRKMALAAAAQDTQGGDMELKEALAEIERLKALLAASEKNQKSAERYDAFLRGEIARKTKAKEMAATRDEKAAERAAAFVQKMSASASVEQLEEMNTDLDEQLKAVLTPNSKAEGAEHVPGADGENKAPRRQPWEPRRLAG